MRGHRCPNCGRVLDRISIDGAPPYLCKPCSRSWWNAELENAQSWRPEFHDFGDNSWAVTAMCKTEAEGKK